MTRIMLSAVGNRALYLWASKLQEYRRSNLSHVLHSLAYAALFIGSATALFFVNFALFKALPGQYSVVGAAPSFVSFYLYSLASLFFSATRNISASGDGAYFIAIIAGLYGPSFLLTVVVNTVLTFKNSHDDFQLENLVGELRAKARKHEKGFEAAVPGGIREVCQRFERLGIDDLPKVVRWIEVEAGPGFPPAADEPNA
jgi:hypothetical protein